MFGKLPALVMLVTLLGVASGCSERLWIRPTQGELRATSPLESSSESSAESSADESSNPGPGSEFGGQSGHKGVQDPIQAEVSQTFVEGSEIVLRVKLHPLKDLLVKDVAIAIIGLKDGVVSSRRVMPLSALVLESQFPQGTLKAGQPVLVQVNTPHADVSELQVVCSWGEDAQRLVGPNTYRTPVANAPQGADTTAQVLQEAIRPAVPTHKIDASVQLAVLERIEIERRAGGCPDCPALLTLVVHLQNPSARPLVGVKLAIGLAFAADGESVPHKPSEMPIEQSEQLVDITDAHIGPGKSQIVRVKFDRGIPRVPGGEFLPTVRILR